VHSRVGDDYEANFGSAAEKPRLLCGTDQTVREGVVHELRSGLKLELPHDARAVHLGRAGRDEELLRDLLIRVAEGDEPEDVELARGQQPGSRSATGR
jgi:hypothetical protein